MRQTDVAHQNFCFAQEFCGLNLGDQRLNKRFVKVIEKFYENPGSLVQRTQGSWAEMISAYRLLGNDRVLPEEILRSHREQTLARMSAYKRVVAIQDTTTLCYSSHPATKGLGSIAQGGRGQKSKGLFLHSTMAMTTTGVPLGFLEQTMWSRGKKRESERYRWLDGIQASAGGNFVEIVCVGDREADGADFFALAKREGVGFVVRAKEKMRKCRDSNKSIVEALKKEPLKDQIQIEVRAQKIKTDKEKSRYRALKNRKAKLTVRCGRVQLRFPKNKLLIDPHVTDQELFVNAVLVEEVNPPKQFEPVCWLLFTSLEIDLKEQVREIIDIYKLRWEIEVFHKILKSACSVEKAQLESVGKLKRLITILTIVAWRLHVLTKLQRDTPNLPCTEILTTVEWHALYVVLMKTKKIPTTPPTLRDAVLWIAKLGGFIGRKSDGEPGAMTLWRGWQKLIHCTEMYCAMEGT